MRIKELTYEEWNPSTPTKEEYKVMQYKKALDWLRTEIGDDQLEWVGDDDMLIYCCENKASVIDLDMWCHYQNLLDDKISYEEYAFLDRKFDGDILDVETKDKELIEAFKEELVCFRKK